MEWEKRVNKRLVRKLLHSLEVAVGGGEQKGKGTDLRHVSEVKQADCNDWLDTGLEV